MYANNSVFSINDIGVTSMPMPAVDNALKCVTDRMPCCEGDAVGEWFFPDDSLVTNISSNPFYRSRGDDGTVNLNRLNAEVTEPAGLYRCQVPDADGINQTLNANIGKSI